MYPGKKVTDCNAFFDKFPVVMLVTRKREQIMGQMRQSADVMQIFFQHCFCPFQIHSGVPQRDFYRRLECGQRRFQLMARVSDKPFLLFHRALNRRQRFSREEISRNGRTYQYHAVRIKQYEKYAVLCLNQILQKVLFLSGRQPESVSIQFETQLYGVQTAVEFACHAPVDNDAECDADRHDDQ